MPDLAPQTIALTIVIAIGEQRYVLTNKDGAPSVVTMVVPISDSWWRDAFNINQAIREQIGLRAILLRCLDVGQDLITGQRTGTVLVESHDLGWTPDDHLTLEALNSSPDSPVGSRFALSAGDPIETIPWTCTGWFTEAADWTRMQLEALGIEIEGEVEQVRAWFLSCILRVATNEGEYYLKAVQPLFRHEPPLTLDLSVSYQGFVPHVVALDVERRWTLMRSVPGVRLDQHPDEALYLPRWEGILRRFAEIQLNYVGHVNNLLAMGCFDFRLDRLYTDFEVLIAELPRLLEGTNSLSTEQIESLPMLLPSLKAMCDALIGSGLPPTLHHGDFHSGNILCDQNCVVLDWSGFVGVSHPFLFLSVVSEEHKNEEVLAQLIEVYLSTWSAYGPPSDLRAFAQMGIVLGWLAGAVGHSRQIPIGDGSWDRAQEQGNLEYCLKMLLQILSAI